MDLEIVGRHALLFDDDATAEVVNSGASLVPWAAAGTTDHLIDRHDVRHLLDRLPPRPRRPYAVSLLSVPSPDGVSEADLDRERFLDLPADDSDGRADASPSGNEKCKDAGQSVYNAIPFSYGSAAGSVDLSTSDLYYRPSFPVPESLLNNLPPSEKVHQIIARTALYVSGHGGQSEIVLRVKQGSNPTFGFLMPDHQHHGYFRYLVDHPHLLKAGTDSAETNEGYKSINSESERAASSGGALSLLGAVYESGEEDEGMLPDSSKITHPGNDDGTHATGQDHEGSAATMDEDKEVRKDQMLTVAMAGTGVKDKPVLTKKNPMLRSGNSIVSAPREKVTGEAAASTTAAKLQKTKSSMSETREVILEPPSFLKRPMEKIVEFILRNGKEFEEKLIEQDRAIGRFPFLLSSNPYNPYYLKLLLEAHESKLPGRSSEHKDSSHGKGGRKSKAQASTSKDSSASDSSAEPSEKQIYDKQGKGKFRMVIGGAKKEAEHSNAPRKVTADEAAAIVMAATRGLSPANAPPNSLKESGDLGRTRRKDARTSSSSLQGLDALSKPASNSEAGLSLSTSGQLKKEGTGIIDDEWIANTIAKTAALAASREADSSEASLTKEQKLKAERLKRAKMFAAIIKSGGNRITDVVATPADLSIESAKASHSEPSAKEHERSSVPFEHEKPNLRKEEDSDEQNKVHKYSKKHDSESDEEKEDSEESYKHSRKTHRSKHSRGHSKDGQKHRRHLSKDRESKCHHRHHHCSSEDEHGHRRSRSRHRHKDDGCHSKDEEHRRSHRHKSDHRSNSKRKREDEHDFRESILGRSEASHDKSDYLLEPEKPPTDTAQSSHAATEVPNELRAKIRAMLMETL